MSLKQMKLNMAGGRNRIRKLQKLKPKDVRVKPAPPAPRKVTQSNNPRIQYKQFSSFEQTTLLSSSTLFYLQAEDNIK